MQSDNWQKRLADFQSQIAILNETFIGYPTNSSFDWPEINPLLHFTLNNAGDPFGNSHYLMNSHEFEKEVVLEIGKLMGLPENDIWGYVNNGGTEGNLEGLWLARERYPDATILYSADTHYSVSKIVKMLRINFIEVSSQADGQIDYKQFANTLDQLPSKQVIVVANFGTTMKGAIDDLEKIFKILLDKKISDHYIHVDAALFGMVCQLVPGKHHLNFQKYPIDSVSISGHKFIGSPVPSGIIVTKKSNIDTVKRSIEYVGILDTTITGSRNAITPIIWWLALHKYGIGHYAALAKECIDLAHTFAGQLSKLGLNAHVNPDSNIVWFDKPAPEICHIWQLATYDDFAHIIVMPHVKSTKLDKFLADLKSST